MSADFDSKHCEINFCGALIQRLDETTKLVVDKTLHWQTFLEIVMKDVHTYYLYSTVDHFLSHVRYCYFNHCYLRGSHLCYKKYGYDKLKNINIKLILQFYIRVEELKGLICFSAVVTLLRAYKLIYLSASDKNF